MTESKTALITGANKGIGYEIAAGLGRLGYRVGIGARDEQRRADAVARLGASSIDAFGVPLDVTDDVSVSAAAASLERLDVLVNNAGVTGGWPQEPTTISLDTVRTAVETNVLGVIRVTNAMLPLLRRSASPRIVNLSSHVASLTAQSSTRAEIGPITGCYAPSKTFLNAVTLQYARELAGSGILINLACPGYVRTDFNAGDGLLSAEEGAQVAIRLATLADGSPSGQLLDDIGTVPW